jgi:cystathionine beta-lyase/cystathionine gamma-synthase
MAYLNAGDHMISSDAVYGASRTMMEGHMSRFGVESTYVKTENVENIKKAIRPNTKMLYIETPANPTMGITDIEACAKIAKEHGLILVVDNTFCSPYLQNPLDMGADVVLHSVTKFINGHADIVGGIVIAKTQELYKKLNVMMLNLGGNMDPHQAYMVIRGLKTLAIRIERAQASAMKVAEFLESNENITWVNYPGLSSNPYYATAQKYMPKGTCGVVSFGVKGGRKAAEKFMKALNIIAIETHVADARSCCLHPASATHRQMNEEELIAAGVPGDLVRLSCGLENYEDLIADIQQALNTL